MTDKSGHSSWLEHAESHPVFVISSLFIAIFMLFVGLAFFLDHRNEIRDAELGLQLRPPGEQSGAIPSTLPRQIVRGQTVYVPLYSHVIIGEGRQLPLAGTLGVRNTDSKRTLTVSSVKYYDTEGKLVRNYLEEPLKINPLGSTTFFVKRSDMSGGSGANFIVEWVSDQPVYAPVIEAVMAARDGTGITSFVRSGQVIEQVQHTE